MKPLLFIIPPAPDEDFTAWLIACAKAGGVKTNYFAENFLGNRLICSGNMYLRNIIQILQTNDDYTLIPSPEEVLYRHSDIMLKGLFSRSWYMGTLISSIMDGICPIFSSVQKRPAYRYCPQCVKEDLKTVGRVVAHIPHQVVSACWKHKCLLTDDLSDNTKVQLADEASFRQAQFVHTLYEQQVSGCIEDVEDIINEHLLKNGVRSLTANTVTESYPQAIQILAELDTDTVISLYKEGNLKRYESDRRTAEETGMEIVSRSGALLTLRCRSCGQEHYMYSGALSPEAACPACKTTDWKSDMSARIRPRLRDDLEIVGFPNFLHVDLLHKPCGALLKNRVTKKLITTGSASCPVCRNASHDSHKGEELVMNCGLTARILHYWGFKKVEIEFVEIGETKIVEYNNFLNRTIIPNEGKQYRHLKQRRMMKCGLEAEIIGYRSNRDIDVQFEDGSILKGVSKDDFINGNLKPKSMTSIKKREFTIKEVVEDWRVMNCGCKVRVIKRLPHDKCTVEFEDGSIRENVSMTSVRRKSLRPTDYHSNDHRGEIRVMHNGLRAEIINQGKGMVIVKFENGDEVTTKYNSFCRGLVRSQTLEREKKDTRIGEKYLQHCGLEAEIIAYYDANNLTVRFSNGEIKEYVRYDKLKSGKVLPLSMRNMKRD